MINIDVDGFGNASGVIVLGAALHWMKYCCNVSFAEFV
jgi:hypothetical protein